MLSRVYGAEARATYLRRTRLMTKFVAASCPLLFDQHHRLDTLEQNSAIHATGLRVRAPWYCVASDCATAKRRKNWEIKRGVTARTGHKRCAGTTDEPPSAIEWPAHENVVGVNIRATVATTASAIVVIVAER